MKITGLIEVLDPFGRAVGDRAQRARLQTAESTTAEGKIATDHRSRFR